MAFACPKQTQTFCGSWRSSHGGRGARSSGHGAWSIGHGASTQWVGRDQKREGSVGFGFRGRDHCDEAEKIDPANPWGERECLAEVWERKREACTAWWDVLWRERERGAHNIRAQCPASRWCRFFWNASLYLWLIHNVHNRTHRPLTNRTGKLSSKWQPIEIGDQEDVDMLLKPSLWEELSCSQEQLAVGDDLHFYHTEKQHNLCHRYKNEILKKKRK